MIHRAFAGYIHYGNFITLTYVGGGFIVRNGSLWREACQSEGSQ
jgi:hypothetical protein